SPPPLAGLRPRGACANASPAMPIGWSVVSPGAAAPPQSSAASLPSFPREVGERRHDTGAGAGLKSRPATNRSPTQAWMTTKVIYIGSAAHSGSTLLDLMLSSHPDVVSVGELKQLRRFCVLDKQFKSCSCGELTIYSCKFWMGVEECVRA